MKTKYLPIETSLTQGQALRARVPSGTHVVVLHGDVHLEGSCGWLGESFPMVGTTLGEGHAHCIERGGWITVLALSDARLLQHVPPSALSTGLRGLRDQVQRLLHWSTPEAKPTASH